MTRLSRHERRLLSFDAEDRFSEQMRIIAHRMFETVMEAELQCYLEIMERTAADKGKRAVVRNGFHKPRTVVVCGRPVLVRAPRIRNRSGGETFSSRIVPRYVRRKLSFDAIIPLAYCRAVAGGNYEKALAMLIRQTGAGYSVEAAKNLEKKWAGLHRVRKLRDLSSKRCRCLWIEAVQSTAVNKNGLSVLAMVIVADRKNDAELLDACYYSPEEPLGYSGALRSLVSRGLKEPEIVAAGAIPPIAGEVKRCFKNSLFLALASGKNEKRRTQLLT